jgi:hypothetical protein
VPAKIRIASAVPTRTYISKHLVELGRVARQRIAGTDTFPQPPKNSCSFLRRTKREEGTLRLLSSQRCYSRTSGSSSAIQRSS